MSKPQSRKATKAQSFLFRGFSFIFIAFSCICALFLISCSINTSQARNNIQAKGEFINIEVRAVAPSETGEGWIVFLDEAGGAGKARSADGQKDKMLAITIGETEGRAILMAYANENGIRPLTHELFAGALKVAGMKVDGCYIHSMSNNAFIARLELIKDGKKSSLDCRPSDGIALALRFSAKIFVSAKLFNEQAVLWPVDKLNAEL
ncbi:bifunctional nuclease family protein [Elusimicrobiota bacterium]